jgi:hypothetical protein
LDFHVHLDALSISLGVLKICVRPSHQLHLEMPDGRQGEYL